MKRDEYKREKLDIAIEKLMTQFCPTKTELGLKIQKPDWTQEDVDFVREMIVTRMMTWGYARKDIYPPVEEEVKA
jgi:hypothetical protein